MKKTDESHVAFKEGYSAHDNGISYKMNPYPKGSQEYEDWETGWFTSTLDRNNDRW